MKCLRENFADLSPLLAPMAALHHLATALPALAAAGAQHRLSNLAVTIGTTRHRSHAASTVTDTAPAVVVAVAGPTPEQEMDSGEMASTFQDQRTHVWSGSSLVLPMIPPSNILVSTSKNTMIFQWRLPVKASQSPLMLSPTHHLMNTSSPTSTSLDTKFLRLCRNTLFQLS